MIKRLRLEFIIINMGIATTLLSAMLGLVLYFTSANLETESIHIMEHIANQPFQMDALSELEEDVRPPFFTLQLGPYGGLLDASDGYYGLSDDASLNDLAQAAATSPRRLGVLEKYSLRYYRSDVPTSRFLAFVDISNGRTTPGGLCRACLLIGGLSFLALLQVSVLLSKWAVRPMERAWQQQRQFITAASHELKTPLAVIMTDAELLQDGGQSTANQAGFLSNILTMSRQIRALIEQMLELARTDSTESYPVLHPVNLSGLTARGLLPFELLLLGQGLTLTSQVDEGITVSDDEEVLRQVPEILLDSAQKYSSPGDGIQVAPHRRGRNHCVLAMANQGEPIPPEARHQIFQHFYRADPVRSRSGSFGLGLSTVEGIVAQHHGTIDVTCAGGFNHFRAELPCRQEQRLRSKPHPGIRE